MRRKKKLFLNLLKVLIVIGIILAIYFLFFKKQKEIETANTTNKTGKVIELVPVNESTEEIELPENIYSETDPNSNKTYSPVTGESETYLISILTNNDVTILIGNDSEKILPDGSPIQIGADYMVSGIEAELKTVYYFNVSGYNYPVFLLLAQDGTITYVDIEEAYRTGNFQVSGKIGGIPAIDNIYETTVEKDGESYRSAILVGTDGQGYEFDLGMIGK
ncbi:MAG: hypothetical protein ACI4VN_04260 [Clostridia bacterium]